jgi:hypothetical protein
MNRIILIGNGFDLANGLKTSYQDFIDWFWKNKIEKIRNNIKEYNKHPQSIDYEDENIAIKISNIESIINKAFGSSITLLSSVEELSELEMAWLEFKITKKQIIK